MSSLKENTTITFLSKQSYWFQGWYTQRNKLFGNWRIPSVQSLIEEIEYFSYLVLSSNIIEDQSAAKIAEGLSSNDSLQILGKADN